MVVYIAWVLYSIMEGAREAVFYAFRDHLKVFIYNEHILYTIQRAIVLGICAYIDPWILLSGPFAFPFFHDGAYYTMRNFLDENIYTEGWFAQSDTSTAWLTKFFTPTVRMICFVISLILAGVLMSGEVKGQGSCGSPDGAMLSITVPPADYNELETGGYCMDGTGSTKWHYMCWTFTPTVSSISINAGYNSSCNIAQFDLATTVLYDKDCSIAGTGQNFSVTPNEEYTWCLRMKASGGPLCNGFDRVCPYYIENTVLPVKLLYLECDSGYVIWQTASEINNDYFSLYCSKDLEKWAHKIDVEGSGNSSVNTLYHYYDSDCTEDLYYLLEQTDYDGTKSFEAIIHCECTEYITPEYTIEEYNIMGQIYDGGGIKILKIIKGNNIVYKKIMKR
jgi:hypothetical protein